MMTAEQQAGLERFAHFLGEMIAKYGVDVLAESVLRAANLKEI